MQFWKYQGTGNDFILVDQRSHLWIRRNDTERIAHLCDRHFGIGADGLILLNAHPVRDFEMVYFNADGRESTFCGNGGRCIVAFAYRLGVRCERYTFIAADGEHEAKLFISDVPRRFWVELRMRDVGPIAPCANPISGEKGFVVNTGSPHYIQWVDNLKGRNVSEEGRRVRYAECFQPGGVNVNFVELNPEGIGLRTYERGVEAETLACGTGVTAAALAWHVRVQLPPGTYEVPVFARGGTLRVRFTATASGYTDIWLCGPAEEVFSGEIDVP
jgi:diaminopimelate epimerase